MRSSFPLSLRSSFAIAGLLLLAQREGAAAETGACSPATIQSLAISGLVISGATIQAAGDGLPEHCIVRGEVNDRTGVDGRHYAIGFEMRLPVDWNGRLLHQMNGGNDGAVLPATGDQPKALASGGAPALARGFAVLSSDSGHSGADPANASLGLAAGAAFGLDPQARRDYGYAADLTLAPIARAMIAAHYGRKPDYSYIVRLLERRPPYDGGGRAHAGSLRRLPRRRSRLRSAARGDPARLGRAGLRQGRSGHPQVDHRETTRRSSRARSLPACDRLDGLEDGLTANLAACQKAFEFDSLDLRPRRETPTACPRPRSTALKASFAGPKTSKGEALYSDWPVDGGVGTGNWRMWKVESPIPPWNHYPIIATMGAASLDYIFTTPPTPVPGTNEALMKSLLDFNFDKDAPKIFARTDAYPESAMEFMTPPGVDDPKLAKFRELGPQDDHLSRPGRSGLFDQRHDPLVRQAERQLRRQGRRFRAPVRGSRHDALQRRRHARQVRRARRAHRLGRKGQGAGHDRRRRSIRPTRRSPPPGARAAPVRSARGRPTRSTRAAIRRVRRRSNARRRETGARRCSGLPAKDTATKASRFLAASCETLAAMFRPPRCRSWRNLRP